MAGEEEKKQHGEEKKQPEEEKKWREEKKKLREEESKWHKENSAGKTYFLFSGNVSLNGAQFFSEIDVIQDVDCFAFSYGRQHLAICINGKGQTVESDQNSATGKLETRTICISVDRSATNQTPSHFVMDIESKLG